MSIERIVLGISGASGIPIAVRTAEALDRRFEVHTVLTDSAKTVLETEPGDRDEMVGRIDAASAARYDEDERAAPIASGSFDTDGMVVVPASMNTVAAIATGRAENLLTRAADVTQKEDRRLVVVPRETPVNEVHLENLLALRRRGVHIVLPVLGFYFDPQSVEDMVDHVVGKILERFDREHDRYDRWN
ncbi:MAG: UbiX family flavin prenyltransferase [Halodesulfurarchaeum sp.]